jgi:hypothetical protein
MLTTRVVQNRSLCLESSVYFRTPLEAHNSKPPDSNVTGLHQRPNTSIIIDQPHAKRYVNRFFTLPDALQALHHMTKRQKRNSYVGVGRLTYRDEGGDLITDLTASREKSLFPRRMKRLILAGSDLADHHHLPHYIGMFS